MSHAALNLHREVMGDDPSALPPNDFQQMSPDLISLSAVVDACARASKQRQAVKFQQIWSDRCHRTTMFELLRFTRRLPNMEKDEKVPAPRGSRWAHGTFAFFVVCFFWMASIL